MSVYGVDLIVGWLGRLTHAPPVEREALLAALRAPEDLVALDHNPEIAALYAAFLADTARAGALASALLALRAQHQQGALDACRAKLRTWVRDGCGSRSEAETMAARWPVLAREQIDYRALERWLRDGVVDSLGAACQLTMRAEDTGQGAPRRFTAVLGDAQPDAEALATASARAVDPTFTLEGARCTTLPPIPPQPLGRREVTWMGPRFGMISAGSSWLDGPSEARRSWSSFARPLGLGHDVWLLVRIEGDEETASRLTLECSAPARVLDALAERFAST